ncbi:MAG TPA: glutamate formimidoyltransferase, partial [bacterium (Candidatus Stahlbacteria)]|nr:glutamate formimidoyltransferase [Candidatus Stahlbacteria bacterium]
MMRLVECVPNFSEGRDKNIIESICDAIRKVKGVYLLDFDPGEATNRTVVTFVGEPEPVLEAAFQAIKKASELIDMSKHKGAHARMGATDVCPFVPVSGVTVDDCVELSHRLGKRVGEELGIPVYLYEYAATRPERKNLATIRKGEYEGLPEKLKDPEWKPDYGPAEFNARSGATVIGCREFLIAYNINLNTKDRKLAHEIALNIREAGRAKRDKDGKIIRDEQGKAIKIPGIFKAVKAVGWYIEEYGLAQVSINFTNYKISPPHLVFDECCRQAEKLGLRVTGSELVGLIPLEAILMAGRYYLRKQGKSPGVPEEELIEIAVRSLGLDQLYPFEPEKKIIEYTVAEKRRFEEMRLRGFVNEVSVDSPTPGGGSVAALLGSMAAALGSMVANLSYKDDELMGEKGMELQRLKDEFLREIERDAQSFDAVIEAMRMKAKTEEAKKAKEEAIKNAYLGAARVP